MAVASSTAAIAGAIITGIGTAYAISSGEEQKREARAAKDKEEKQILANEAEAVKQDKNRKALESEGKRRDMAIRSQKSAQKSGREGTILTGFNDTSESVAADSDEVKPQYKTLLGS